MAKLKPGAVTIDLITGGVYGDFDHCPREELLESAEALLSLLPRVEHKGLWGLGKDFDADCYVHTTAKKYQVPEGLQLAADIYRGTGGLSASRKPFRLFAFSIADRNFYWEITWYSKLVGSVRDGKVSADTEGIPDLTAERRAEMARREAEKPRQLKIEL